jgi:hypothetical protein
MTELLTKCEVGGLSAEAMARLVQQVNRVETQAALLLRALHSIYVALGAFASATLVTLLGAGVASFQGGLWLRAMAWLGFMLGVVGVSGLVFGCASLLTATRLSLINIREEAAFIRKRLAVFKNGEIR